MIFGTKYAKIPLFHTRERPPIRVVGDAVIAAPNVGEGRLIPLVILDTTTRPDVAEYIRAHEFHGPGDVKTQWGRTGKDINKIDLVLTFTNPTELVAIVEFDISRQGAIIEQILSSRALYIQAGKEGDRLKHDLNKPKVILEIPETGFRKKWDGIYFKATVGEMKRQGLNRHEAKRAARLAIDEMRKMGALRVPTPRNPGSKYFVARD